MQSIHLFFWVGGGVRLWGRNLYFVENEGEMQVQVQTQMVAKQSGRRN